jgi:hypothetical protein
MWLIRQFSYSFNPVATTGVLKITEMAVWQFNPGILAPDCTIYASPQKPDSNLRYEN